MKIINDELLDDFRGPGRCEMCGRWCKRRETHHILPSGMDGGGRMDVAINLLSVGGHYHGGFPICACHHRAQERATGFTLMDQCTIVAKREGYPSGEAVLDELYRLRRQKKSSNSVE